MKQRDKQQGEKFFIIGFCVFFTVALFLGDGKQHTVDVFAAAVILLSLAAARYWRMLQRPIPLHAQIFWLALIGYYIARTIASDSVGYSITATMRIIDAYLVYTLFYSIASLRALRLFVYGIVGVACVAVGAAALLLLAPDIATQLPSMNLLYGTYRHNHLADVLVFALPVVFMMNAGKKSALLWGIISIFLLAAVVTF
ncbi:hypothetical protein HY031_00990, partial [Candidatus Gottesmanbacteria bacterium]|nr:hypothetical protein [Candidatus Gottesmanbacteria bacterium]